MGLFFFNSACTYSWKCFCMIVQTYGKHFTYNLVITIQINIVVAVVDNFFQIFMDFILLFFLHIFSIICNWLVIFCGKLKW